MRSYYMDFYSFPPYGGKLLAVLLGMLGTLFLFLPAV